MALDIFQAVGAGATVSLVGLCISLAKNKNGAYVKKDDCIRNHDGVSKQIDTLKNHVDIRFDDLNIRIDDIKDLIKDGK